MSDLWTVITGDCLDVMRSIEDEFVDAVVTDPPGAIKFMGKEWDSDRGGREQWAAWLAERLREAYRILKPGGHILVWAIPRRSHWTGIAIEDASFEIRDRVSHLCGQRFPKGGGSSSISKAIDKALGAERKVIGENPNHRAISGVNYEGVYAGGNTGSKYLTAPATTEAEEWEGWSGFLKPACEDWWLARKPFKGPLYKNVLKYGTGALNIDACRVPTEDKLTRKLGKTTVSDSGWVSANRSPIAGKDGGRWPANVVLDEEAAAMLDQQSGQSKSRKGKPRKSKNPGEGYGMTHTGAEYDDEGGASRFFYCAKPTKRERNAGLEDLKNDHPTAKSVELMRWLSRLITPPQGVILDPFCGSGTTGVACVHEDFGFIGIEEEERYAEIARQRIAYTELSQRRGINSP